MWKINLLLTLFLHTLYASGQDYLGPKSIGSFHIDRIILVSDLFQRLGQYPKTKSECYCYQASDGQSYLWFVRRAHEPKQAGGVLLSRFQNCIGQPIQITSENISDWKTEKSVGLGSTLADVQKAYGKPSEFHKIKDADYLWVIKGFHSSKENMPERGDSVMVYNGPENDLRGADFGICKGKVVWIFLSDNE